MTVDEFKEKLKTLPQPLDSFNCNIALLQAVEGWRQEEEAHAKTRALEFSMRGGRTWGLRYKDYQEEVTARPS